MNRHRIPGDLHLLKFLKDLCEPTSRITGACNLELNSSCAGWLNGDSDLEEGLLLPMTFPEGGGLGRALNARAALRMAQTVGPKCHPMHVYERFHGPKRAHVETTACLKQLFLDITSNIWVCGSCNMHLTHLFNETVSVGTWGVPSLGRGSPRVKTDVTMPWMWAPPFVGTPVGLILHDLWRFEDHD